MDIEREREKKKEKKQKKNGKSELIETVVWEKAVLLCRSQSFAELDDCDIRSERHA